MELTIVIIVEGRKVYISIIIISVTLLMIENVKYCKRTFEKYAV